VPVRYDRELVQTTVKAMQRIGEIKARRERAFFKHRYGKLFLRTFSMIPIRPLEWLQVETNKEHTAKRLLKLPNPLLSSGNPYPLRRRRRKSRWPSKQKAHSCQERVAPWEWRWTEFLLNYFLITIVIMYASISTIVCVWL
jgi:hypothetical protein